MNIPSPFAALGLPARPGLTDEQVRAAWRAIATATHPDRPGGGDPARYAAASAAYAVLRTAWGRSEAYADLSAATPPPPAAAGHIRSRLPAARALRMLAGARLAPARVRHGRPLYPVARLLAAALLIVVTVYSQAGGPATAGVVAGLVLWCALTVRGDLAPPPGR
jgi:hypothetical protein